MKKYSYLGEKYRQGDSDLQLISFCADARDIYKWAGVPAKTEKFHGGFQRALTDRYKRIIKFFNDDQASPTSIVVAFRENALTVTDQAYPPGWVGKETLDYVPKFVHVSLDLEELDPNSSALEDLLERVRTLIEPRVLAGGPDSPDGEDEDEDEDGEEDKTGDDDAPEDDEREDDESSEELDVGHSKLKEFYKFITEESRWKSWLVEEQKKYDEAKSKSKKSKKDKDVLEFTPEQRLKSLLISLLRPAMIVDGQHRVWGAYNSDKEPIVFNVCAIKDADWVEQVFQFVVLNKLAKPISPSFLTGLLNTSLTNSEVKTIEERLECIGIKNTDRILMKFLNHHEESPFRNMVAEAGEIVGIDNRGKLSDKGMIRLAKRWYVLNNDTKTIKMFQKSLGAKNISDARRKWREDGEWSKYFYGFWGVVRAKYEPAGLWEKGANLYLLFIVTMHAMQDMFLDNKRRAFVEFDDYADFEKQVKTFFEDVPATFFQGWEKPGLQSGDGPDLIKDAIEQFQDGRTLKTVQSSSQLFQKVK